MKAKEKDIKPRRSRWRVQQDTLSWLRRATRDGLESDFERLRSVLDTCIYGPEDDEEVDYRMFYAASAGIDDVVDDAVDTQVAGGIWEAVLEAPR